MTKEELLVIANDIVREDQPGVTLTLETRFDEDLNLDSLEVVEFALQMEEKIGVKIPDSIMDDAKTVGDIINALTIAV